MTSLEPHILSAAMRRACQEARLWLGATSPNPPVGAAALDKDGHILAVAAHQQSGGDHAEAALLKICRKQNILSQVHTICVTLEPCNHHGRTPPCTEALITAGIRHIAVGTHDPNPYVRGGGCERLREAGIEVIENVESEMCRRLIHAFAFQIINKKPFITIKRAFNAHGSMIPPVGQKTFASQNSLVLAHRLRKKADVIITGSGTVLIDDPLFTVRYVKDHEDKRQLVVILDRRGRVPRDYIERSAARGVDVLIYSDIKTCLSDLKKPGIQDILVESGPTLSQFMLDSGLWTMRIDIHCSESGSEDEVEVSFNQNTIIPFDISKLDLNSILPL